MNSPFILFIILLFHPSYSFFINNIFSFFRYRNQKCIQDNCCHKDKKLIILTPGGLYGFYTLGVSCYIKNHYNLTDFIFSGSSAGSWNSLFLSYQGNQSIEKPFLEFTKHLQNNTSNLYQMQTSIKSFLLNNFSHDDFDLNKTTVGVTTLSKRLHFKLMLYSHFCDLEDFVNCCMASSHIPFISGRVFHFYKRKLSLDGGFVKYPYLNYLTPSFVISPSMWNSTYTNSSGPLGSLTLSKHNSPNFTELFIQGYNDTKNNKHILDTIFPLL